MGIVKMNQNRTFIHENQSFEIRVATFDERYCVRVFLNGSQVSPEYSATLEVGQDFFSQHQESLVSQLASHAEADIRRGCYFKV